MSVEGVASVTNPQMFKPNASKELLIETNNTIKSNKKPKLNSYAMTPAHIKFN